MSPFTVLDHLDTWALSASLRSKRSLLKDGLFPAYLSGRLHKEVRAWKPLAATINDIRHLPGANTREIGDIELIELLPSVEHSWRRREGWARGQVAIVTNPCAYVFSGPAAQHLPIGALTLIDQTWPVCCVNWGKSPVIYLVVWIRAKEIRDE